MSVIDALPSTLEHLTVYFRGVEPEVANAFISTFSTQLPTRLTRLQTVGLLSDSFSEK